MPNRILRDWTDSERVNQLSFEAEVFFTRLIMKADDFGYFHANPKLVIAALFPLKEISSEQITKWIEECVGAELIFLYENSGKKYLKINDFKQRLRTMVSKFPSDADNSRTTRGQLADNSRPEGKGREGNPEYEVEKKPEGRGAAAKIIVLNKTGDEIRADLNSEDKKNMFRQIAAKFPETNKEIINQVIDGYIGKFNIKFPKGGTKDNFLLHWTYHITDMKILPKTISSGNKLSYSIRKK